MHAFEERSAPLFTQPRSALAIGDLLNAVIRRYRAGVTYRELMALDDRQLADIGLDRSEIARIARPA
jgi:uncharacterized protein YjiS (DUF1127 family)